MVQEKCDLYKLEIYGLNQTSYSNNLLVELKQFLRNDLKLKFSNLEYNPQTQATVIFFQYKSDFDCAHHVFSRRVQWRTFHFSVDSRPVDKSPTCDKKSVVPTAGSGQEGDRLDLSMSTSSAFNHTNNNGTKEHMSQRLEEHIQTHYPLLSVPYDTQLKGKQEHVLQTYSNLFQQYSNFKQLHTFHSFMKTKYGDSRPFLFNGMVARSERDARNLLELSIGLDVETNQPSVGFPINDDPSLKSPCLVIPLRDVYSRHCLNIPKQFVAATEVIEKIIRTSGVQISCNYGNSMGVWYRVSYRYHDRVQNPGTAHEKTVPQLMITFHIRPGYKLTPEIVDYISDFILDEVLSQNNMHSLDLASVYIQRDHPIPFQERSDSDDYLKLMEEHWKYLPEFWKVWGSEYLEDHCLNLKVLPYSQLPSSAHQYKVRTQALRELLADVNQDYTIVDINCSTGILGGSLYNKVKQLKFITPNILSQSTIESHLELLASSSSSSNSITSCDITRYKRSRTHYLTRNCEHSQDGTCILCAMSSSNNTTNMNGGVSEEKPNAVSTASSSASSNHVKTSGITTEQKIDTVNKVLSEATGEKVVVIYHYNSGDDFCDDFFKLIQYNTKIEKVLFVTDSSHNLNSNLVVQCIPYVMTHVYSIDTESHTHLYHVMVLFERLESNISHDQVQLGFKFNGKQQLIDTLRQDTERAEKERQATFERLKAEAASKPPPLPPSSEVATKTTSDPVNSNPSNHQNNRDVRYQPRHPSSGHPGPPYPGASNSLPPPPNLRYPPSPFVPRALPPSRLPPPPSYTQRQRFGPPEVYGPPGVGLSSQHSQGRSTGNNMNSPSPARYSSDSPSQDHNQYKRKPSTDPTDSNRQSAEPPDHRNKKPKVDTNSSYLHHSASSSPSHPSTVSPQVSNSSSYGGGASFSHSSATQTGFQPYSKPPPSAPGAGSRFFPPPMSNAPLGMGSLPPLPPPAHSSTPHSISDLTGKKDGLSSRMPPDMKDPSRRYNNVPSSSPSSAGKPSPSQSPYPPLPPKQSPKPPLPNDPPKDTKDSKDLAPMGYGQMSQADMLKIYEAQMAAYMPGLPGASNLYAMQLAEAQMLQAAQAAQISSAQKLYAAQVASIEEQQKQYTMQLQAAHAAKIHSEKVALAQAQHEQQMKAQQEQQLKAQQEQQLKAQQQQQMKAQHEQQMKAQQAHRASMYPMSDAQKLQHNAQVQMMHDAAQHQHLAAAEMRKLYEDQLMYDLLHQQALALGYPPGQAPAGLYQQAGPRLMQMHPMYSAPLMYGAPPSAAPGLLPYDPLPPRPR